jgi:hypothetical protein
MAMLQHNTERGSFGGEKLQRASLYQSLQRKPYLLGLPQDAFFLVALIIVCLSIAARLDPKVLAGCALFYLVLLPILRALFEKEPYLMDIIPRAVRYSDVYPRQAKEQARPWADRVDPSVPSGRSLSA